MRTQRTTIAALLGAAVLLLLSVGTAGAVAISIVADGLNIAPSAVTTSDTVAVRLFLNTEGSTGVQSIFVSVQATGDLTYASGNSIGSILVNTTPYGGQASVGKIADPYVLGADPAGAVRAASFNAASPSGATASNQFLSIIRFHVDKSAAAGGTGEVDVLFQGGDSLVDDGVQIKGSTSLLGGPVTLVPEPALASMTFIALGAITALRLRRKS